MDVRIVQTLERVWLEITEEEHIAGYLVDQTIRRSDLAFCCGKSDDSKYFAPADPVSRNSDKFVAEWTPYAIIMTTDLFHEAACRQIESDPALNPHWRGD